MNKSVLENVINGGFYAISGKIQPDFKNKGVKMVLIPLAPKKAVLCVFATNPKEMKEQNTI